MTQERRTLLLKRKHLLETKLGEMSPAEIIWLADIDAELASE